MHENRLREIEYSTAHRSACEDQLLSTCSHDARCDYTLIRITSIKNELTTLAELVQKKKKKKKKSKTHLKHGIETGTDGGDTDGREFLCDAVDNVIRVDGDAD